MKSALELDQPKWLQGATLHWKESSATTFAPYVARAAKFAIDNNYREDVIDDLYMLYRVLLIKSDKELQND